MSEVESGFLDLIPLFARVIVLRKTLPKRIGSLYVPQTSKEMEPTEGTVVATGDECEKVKVGDDVYFGRYSGFVFERNKNTYVFCNEEDILAIVTKDGA
jgi:chaperonin GroES